jgi:hypothetical protein
MSHSDVEESNWLLAYDGQIENGFLEKGKKKPPSKKKADSKKETPTKKTKQEIQQSRARAREEKKDLKDLEKRRKKRTKDREKILARKQKRLRAAAEDESDDEDNGLLLDKRARATAIVKGYLTRLGQQEDESKNLVLNSVMTIPASVVDSTGLIGMALAFRSVAGLFPMPDESEEQVEKTTKPWTAVDTTSQKTSSERCEQLERQIHLLQAEIDRSTSNAARRAELKEAALEQLRLQMMEIEADEVVARQNHFKKKRRASPKSKSGDKSKEDEVDDEESIPPEDFEEADSTTDYPMAADSTEDAPMPDAENLPLASGAAD